MIELKRINDTCPVCGKKFRDLNMKFKEGYCVKVKAICQCGYFMKTNSYYGKQYSLDGFKFITQCDDEDAIDKWNKVNHE